MILSTGIGPNGQMSYIYKYGTSMACPHVSGVVALGASYALKIGKKFSREEFVSRLLGSAHEIDSYQNGSANKLWVRSYYDANAALPGWKSEYLNTDVFAKKGKMGTGAVDAWNFLMALEGTPSFMTTPGQRLTINVGEGYSLEIDAEDAEALGIEGTPQVKDGIMEVTCRSVITPSLSGRSARMLPGVLPSIIFAVLPDAMTSCFARSILTTEGARNTMPLSLRYIIVFEVPKSIPICFAIPCTSFLWFFVVFLFFCFLKPFLEKGFQTSQKLSQRKVLECDQIDQFLRSNTVSP
jgi:hypothetical protein